MATEFDPRFDPAYQRGYEGAVAPAAIAPAMPETVEATTQGRNPWLGVLWAIAAVLLVAGVVGLLWAPSQTNPDSEVTGVVYPALVAALAPWLASVGLLGVVLAVFVQASRWRQ